MLMHKETHHDSASQNSLQEHKKLHQNKNYNIYQFTSSALLLVFLRVVIL